MKTATTMIKNANNLVCGFQTLRYVTSPVAKLFQPQVDGVRKNLARISVFAGSIMASLSLVISLFPLVAFICGYVYYKLVSSKYWLKLNVPHLKPFFILGNSWRAGLIENVVEVQKKWHLEHKEKKILGFWTFSRPTLLVMDLEIIKRILIRDFNNFRDRGLEIDTELDPLAGHLFLLGGKKWRNLRVKLTPTFTTGKIKMMFPTMARCGEELCRKVVKAADNRETIEVKDLLARFTTDVISSCAFGIETNSLQNPDSEFRQFGRKIFDTSFRNVLTNLLLGLYPPLPKLLRHRLIPKDISDFFINAVKDSIEYREKNNVKRNDFLQLLIQLIRAGKIEDADRTNVEEMDDIEIIQKFSLNEAAAQCFVFFVGGFETSSTALTFGLYELALNPEIQTKLHKEIDETLKKFDNKINYEMLQEMPYLDKVVQETLRKYPPVGFLQRKCINDYPIPELGVTVDKGTMILINVAGIHHDPNLYPDPEKFDPDRFSDDEKSARNPFAYLPFGEGPRNCIGNRFALMQVKLGFISVLKDCKVEVCKQTPIPIVLDARTFIPTPKGGMHLAVTKRV